MSWNFNEFFLFTFGTFSLAINNIKISQSTYITQRCYLYLLNLTGRRQDVRHLRLRLHLQKHHYIIHHYIILFIYYNNNAGLLL